MSEHLSLIWSSLFTLEKQLFKKLLFKYYLPSQTVVVLPSFGSLVFKEGSAYELIEPVGSGVTSIEISLIRVPVGE